MTQNIMLSGNLKFDLMETSNQICKNLIPRYNQLVIHKSTGMLQVWNAEQFPLIKELFIRGDSSQT